VKPSEFDYFRATSIEEAWTALDDDGDDVAVIAGGHSLIAVMNLRLASPARLVDVARIPELHGIDVSATAVSIRAATPARRVERGLNVRRVLPVLPAAITHIGHPQIRSRTTIGGNIAHADPASELPAVLVGLEGDVELASGGSTRRVQAANFFLGTWTTARRPGELVTEVRFPVRRGWQCAFHEFARRPGDFALAGAFVGVELVSGQITDCRIALCGVADTPVRVEAAEAAAVGMEFGPDLEAVISSTIASTISPSDVDGCSGDYRRHLAATVAVRAIRSLQSKGGP
jgi:carbon-monoxide dehydrogenase medium subunit